MPAVKTLISLVGFLAVLLGPAVPFAAAAPAAARPVIVLTACGYQICPVKANRS
jgi:hypothetical protein